MFKKVLVIGSLSIFALMLVAVIIIAVQPADYAVERSATIEAPIDVVFEQVDDLRRWDDWSTWSQIDPDYDTQFDGPDRGEGAVFEWSGNPEVGAGRMTIVESRPDEFIEIYLEFFEPFETSSSTEFAFTAEGEDATTVTWSMSGEHDFAGKAFSLFVDFEEVIGTDYEEGLVRLDEAAQSAAMASADSE